MKAHFPCAGVVALLGPLAAFAQQNQPIYPVYDGFLKNPDGSYTLSFAYFSHNADTVTIAPGSANNSSRQHPAIACSRRRSSRATGDFNA